MVNRLSKKLLNWASILDDGTREQAERTARMPFVYPHMALMPDAHLGKGATVGSVIPTLGAVMPAAVGVDIGCGMLAIRTALTTNDLLGNPNKAARLPMLRKAIEAVIPTSPGSYNDHIADEDRGDIIALENRACGSGFDPGRYGENWREQCGTLGGGNHFIEVSQDEDHRVWVFLHSGSRGVGNKIAQHHIAVAKALMEKYWIQLADPDLAYLVEGTDEFDSYINQMMWAQDFATFSRSIMMRRTLRCLEDFMGTSIPVDEPIECRHNYSTWETHAGKEVIVSRKGAIDAHEGVMGLIPGSMGAASYVVRGKGNEASLCSAPHGAGRLYSRHAAREKFTRDDLREAMKGIEYRDSNSLVDEIPAAYKPIDQVMTDAADLVEVVHKLSQIINVKGD